jgi:hypothetical protein
LAKVRLVETECWPAHPFKPRYAPYRHERTQTCSSLLTPMIPWKSSI